MKTGIIYCYFNPFNEKRYIGQTIDERSRRSAFKTKELYCSKLENGGKLLMELSEEEYNLLLETGKVLLTEKNGKIILE